MQKDALERGIRQIEKNLPPEVMAQFMSGMIDSLLAAIGRGDEEDRDRIEAEITRLSETRVKPMDRSKWVLYERKFIRLSRNYVWYI